MADTIVLSAEQRAPFRTHNVTKNDSNSVEQPWLGADHDGKVSVTIPDMFVLFLSGPPRVNPNYARVKAESEAWFAEYVYLP